MLRGQRGGCILLFNHSLNLSVESRFGGLYASSFSDTLAYENASGDNRSHEDEHYYDQY